MTSSNAYLLCPTLKGHPLKPIENHKWPFYKTSYGFTVIVALVERGQDLHCDASVTFDGQQWHISAVFRLPNGQRFDLINLPKKNRKLVFSSYDVSRNYGRKITKEMKKDWILEHHFLTGKITSEQKGVMGLFIPDNLLGWCTVFSPETKMLCAIHKMKKNMDVLYKESCGQT